MAEEAKHEGGSYLVRAGAALFATVLAPILVAAGVKVADKITDGVKAEASQTATVSAPAAPTTVVSPIVNPADAHAAAAAPTSAPTLPSLLPPGGPPRMPGVSPPAIGPPPVAVAPTTAIALRPSPVGLPTPPLEAARALHSASTIAAEPPSTDQGVPARGTLAEVPLFNGVDLKGFYTWFESPQKGFAKNEDPDRVASVRDGVLRLSGKHQGGIVTNKEFADYHLTVEYRWVNPAGPSQAKKTRASGVLLHCLGRDGAVSDAWMRSIRCSLTEGSAGDLAVMSHDRNLPSRFTIAAETRAVGPNGQRLLHYHKPDARPTIFKAGLVKRFPSGPWAEVAEFRGEELEKPVGEWNTVECVCDDDRIVVMLNGQPVNLATECRPRRGKIMLQSNGAEIEFRRVGLAPLSTKQPSGPQLTASGAGTSR